MAEDQQGQAHATTSTAAQDHQSVPPTGTVVDPSIAAPQTNAKSANAKHAPEEEPFPRFIRPEWVIVYITAIYAFISALMLLAIKRQAEWMKTQTEHMGEQVGLIKRQMGIQEAEMQQWIEVGNWKAERESTARGKGLRITVEIANPTSFPLMISQGQIRVASRRGGTNTWITGDYYLIPKSPLIVTFHFQITDIEHDQEFQNGRMDFNVEGSLSYVDTLKNRNTQPVGGVLTCNSKRTHLTPRAGAMEQWDSDQPQDPN